jgi:tetratricopeptide (TPR) repeat protein
VQRTHSTLGLLLLLLTSALAPRGVLAAPPADADVGAAEEDQNRQLAEARHGGSMAGVVSQALSRQLRSPSTLNLYLLGRAQFHAGDLPGAERSMRDVVAQEPGFWQAHLRLGMLAAQADDLARAKQHLDLLARLRPEEPGVLRLKADVAVRGKDWAGALEALRGLLRLTPDALPLKLGIAEMLANKGDWASAYQELRPLRLTLARDPRVRYAYARAAFQTKRLDEAAAELEALAKEDPQAVGALDLLRQVYAQQRDWPKLATTLERLRPFAKPEDRPKLDETVAALRSGKVPGEGEPAPQGPVDPVVALFERCLSPDVTTRRSALQEVHEANLGVIPNAIVMRYHPQEEPDPICRAWVLRLVGQLDNDQSVRVPGHALQDPDPLVRRVAAETLGQLGTPAGVLYLLSVVPDLSLRADAPVAVVEEYNAARAALVKITSWDDLPLEATTRWVEAAGLEASWKRWEAWLASPAGTQAKLAAIEDLVLTGETHPEWYLLIQVYDPAPAVAVASYKALLGIAARPTQDPVAKKLWPRFPKATEQDLTFPAPTAESPAPRGFPAFRERIKAWWTEWLAERRAEPK